MKTTPKMLVNPTAVQAKDIADRLNVGERVHGNWGFEEIEPSFHRHLDEALDSLGWKVWAKLDHCSKATRESNWEKDGVKVNIVTACCLGMFTQVSTN